MYPVDVRHCDSIDSRMKDVEHELGEIMTNRNLPWLRIVVQGAVIVASILLAFGIDAWWADRQDTERGRALLGSVREEFVQHRTTLASDLEATMERKHNIERLFQAMGSGTHMAPTTMDTMLYSLTYSPTFDPGSGPLHAMIASGQLGLVRNTQLRDRLSSWQGMVDEVRDNQVAMRGFILGEIVPYLASRGVPLVRNSMRGEDPFPWPIMPDDEVATIYRLLLDDRQFETLAKMRYVWLRLDEHEDAIRFADSVIALIDTELGE